MSVVSIGEDIETRRKKLGYSQAELAHLVHISRGTIVKLENGNGNGVAVGTVNEILMALGLELTTKIHPSRLYSPTTTYEDYALAAMLETPSGAANTTHA